MKFKGLTGKLAKHLSYRLAKEGDKLADGSDVDDNYVVIVHKKNCPTYEKEGVTYIDPSDAPAIADMSGHSTSRLVYGCLKKRKADEFRGVIVENDNGVKERVYDEDYFTTNVYFANGNRVYRASIRRKDTPKMRERFEAEQEKHNL